MHAGAVATPARAPADPRPEVVDAPYGHAIVGGRCTACGHPAATRAPRCARCGSAMVPARFGPEGTVWATTTIHVPSGEREAPYTLAYVDLVAGPRMLAHVADGPAVDLRPAERVRLVGVTAHGDPEVEVIR